MTNFDLSTDVVTAFRRTVECYHGPPASRTLRTSQLRTYVTTQDVNSGAGYRLVVGPPVWLGRSLISMLVPHGSVMNAIPIPWSLTE